jgi:DNA-binding beta-propeller fold protein YncE
VQAGPSAGTPMGIACRDDSLYICDTFTNCVHVWNLATGASRRLGTGGDLAKPVAVAVDSEGVVYVADTLRSQVLAFDTAGVVSRRFEPAREGDYRPVALAVRGSELYVADMARHHVDVYSTAGGGLVRSFGGSGEQRLYYPSGLAVDEQGRVYVSDMMNARVQVFDDEGRSIGLIGSPGAAYGNIGMPKDVALAPDGTVFVADSEFSCVHLFNQRGQLLMLMGGPQDGPGGTPLPNAVAIALELPDDLDRLVPADFEAAYYLWVSNTTGQRRLSLFAVGHSATDRPQ